MMASRELGVRTSGFTLIEILVTLVVLSIGLLGLAALQMIGLQGSHGAHLRSQASILAYDIADRIRANRSAAAGYAIALDDDAPTCGATPTVACLDLVEWKGLLEGSLPSGTGAVVVVGGDESVSVTVQWRDNLQDAGDAAFTLTLDVDL